MRLIDRDAQILVLIGRFGQLTFRHIRALAFPTQRSKTSTSKVLDRLMEYGWVGTLTQRPVGGPQGGSGQLVYTLAAEGLRLTGVNRPRRRTVDPHGLAVADVFVSLAGTFGIDPHSRDAYQVEDEAWRSFDGVEVRPDLAVALGRPTREPLRLWLEVDLGTESRRQVLDKLRAYCLAIDAARGSWSGEWPLTVWVASKPDRADELRRIIGGLDQDDQSLFAVTTADDLSGWILRSFYS